MCCRLPLAGATRSSGRFARGHTNVVCHKKPIQPIRCNRSERSSRGNTGLFRESRNVRFSNPGLVEIFVNVRKVIGFAGCVSFESWAGLATSTETHSLQAATGFDGRRRSSSRAHRILGSVGPLSPREREGRDQLPPADLPSSSQPAARRLPPPSLSSV